MADDRVKVPQNTGVLDQQGQAGDADRQIINGETTPPGSFGKTEGGVPSGTPLAATPPGALSGEGMVVEGSEDAASGQGTSS